MKLESRLPGEISITSDMQMDTTLMAASEEELKSFLIRVKEESEKAGLKLNIKKLRSWYSVPLLHGKLKGKKVAAVAAFISWAAESLWMVTCSHEIKTFLPWKENYGKPRKHIKKQRHHFTSKGVYSQSYGFSSRHVQM